MPLSVRFSIRTLGRLPDPLAPESPALVKVISWAVGLAVVSVVAYLAATYGISETAGVAPLGPTIGVALAFTILFVVLVRRGSSSSDDADQAPRS